MSRKRAIPVTDKVGTTYLVHLDPPLEHAKHYAGWAKDLDKRLADHEAGRGSRLLAAQLARGGSWHLARIWPETTNAQEKTIKDSGHLPRYCPDCKEKTMDAEVGAEQQGPSLAEILLGGGGGSELSMDAGQGGGTMIEMEAEADSDWELEL